MRIKVDVITSKQLTLADALSVFSHSFYVKWEKQQYETHTIQKVNRNRKIAIVRFSKGNYGANILIN